jgi:hypothetical protein
MGDRYVKNLFAFDTRNGLLAHLSRPGAGDNKNFLFGFTVLAFHGHSGEALVGHGSFSVLGFTQQRAG